DMNGVHAETPQALQVFAKTEELLDRKVLAERARDGIDRLPDLYREAFVLRDLEELDTAEVARILEIEPATVRQRVHRARLMLRGYLDNVANLASRTDQAQEGRKRS
ncbi:MAG: sigma-70 family RNA polymerase sigma factor, partial [Vicinamibacteria bacterium]